MKDYRIATTDKSQLDRKPVNAKKLASDIVEDLSLLSKQNGIDLQAVNDIPEKEIQVDAALMYRVLENIINNALRYANRQIQLPSFLPIREKMREKARNRGRKNAENIGVSRGFVRLQVKISFLTSNYVERKGPVVLK